jgi:hypothetical protein
VNVRDFTRDEQVRLIGTARDNLVAAGANGLRAFRAGNFGANADTLAALRDLGIGFDSSYDLAATTGPFLPQRVLCPATIDGIREVPIGVFRTRGGGYRHAQIGAASFEEIALAIEGAEADGWPLFVVFWHSAELLSSDRRRASSIAVRRFMRLVCFLAEHRDRFPTVGFAELGDANLFETVVETPPSINGWPTLRRHAEQACRRLGF